MVFDRSRSRGARCWSIYQGGGDRPAGPFVQIFNRFSFHIQYGKKQFDDVEKVDVVILPAFGAGVYEMLTLSNKSVQIVDTTCPWVVKVWNVVEKHKKGEYTSIFHGKYAHEQTFATASFTGTYIIVKNVQRGMFVLMYWNLMGLAQRRRPLWRNLKMQFQMGKLVETTLMRKYGVENINKHFISFNTICAATQECQDAMYKLVDEPLDLVLVVGGWNSSNTSHLQEIVEDHGIPSYWIDSEKRIGQGNRIAYKLNIMISCKRPVGDDLLPASISSAIGKPKSSIRYTRKTDGFQRVEKPQVHFHLAQRRLSTIRINLPPPPKGSELDQFIQCEDHLMISEGLTNNTKQCLSECQGMQRCATFNLQFHPTTI